jgi:transcriptional regulator with XRE-family HTH domain
MGLSKNIAYRLRTLREAAGLSQQEVAERADLSLSLIAKMEQGRKADPRASTILTLAKALGVRPGQLIEDLTSPPDSSFPEKRKKGKKKKKKRQPGVEDWDVGAAAEWETILAPLQKNHPHLATAWAALGRWFRAHPWFQTVEEGVLGAEIVGSDAPTLALALGELVSSGALVRYYRLRSPSGAFVGGEFNDWRDIPDRLRDALGKTHTIDQLRLVTIYSPAVSTTQLTSHIAAAAAASPSLGQDPGGRSARGKR